MDTRGVNLARLRTGAYVVGVLTLAVAAFAIGRGSTSERTSEPPASTVAPQGAAPLNAYFRQQTLLGDPQFWLLKPGKRAEALAKTIASPGLRRSIEHSISTAVRSTSPVGQALTSGQPVLARSIPFGYRVLSRNGKQATFDVWALSLLGGVGIPLDLRLVQYRIAEVRRGDGWLLAQTSEIGEGSAVRFRGAPELSSRLAKSLDAFKELQVEP